MKRKDELGLSTALPGQGSRVCVTLVPSSYPMEPAIISASQADFIWTVGIKQSSEGGSTTDRRDLPHALLHTGGQIFPSAWQ